MSKNDADTTTIDGNKPELGKTIARDFLCLGLMVQRVCFHFQILKLLTPETMGFPPPLRTMQILKTLNVSHIDYVFVDPYISGQFRGVISRLE